MLALASGFKQKLFSANFNFPKTVHLLFPRPLSFPLMATLPRVSSPPYSTTSLNNGLVKRVGTHNGSFHCDEALGCFMIRLTNKYADSEIVRTRDPQVLETLDAVLDVGGVYDPSRDRFDHHQKGFQEVFGHGFSTKLSSAGLVYKAIDAVDNGINQYDTDKPPRYVNNTHLSSRVGRLNLDWTDPDQSPEKENEAFQRAMALAGSEFLDSVRFHAKSWLPARSVVLECLAARFDIDPSGEIMVLTRFCPWKLHLFELEEEMKIEPSIKYVLYEDDRSKQWRIQAVAVSPESFESRKPLPAEWRGFRDEELSKQSGIPACVFVHMSGFIGGNQSYEGALAMAKAALKL
ncbi:MYG1 protein [Linum perenne]